jgi:hypothetical protein
MTELERRKNKEKYGRAMEQRKLKAKKRREINYIYII